MKKYIASLFALIAFLGVHAQKMNVESAVLSFNDQEEAENPDYTKAKEYIDEASANEKTSNYYKMHYYKGEIYHALYGDDDYETEDRGKLAKIALESFIKAIDTDEKERLKDEALKGVVKAAFNVFNEGVKAYQNGNYDKAIAYLDFVKKAYEYDEQGDLKRNNLTKERTLLFQVYAYNEAKQYENAEKNLKKLIEMAYMDPNVYIQLSNIQLTQGDTTAALKTVEEGRATFPESADLISMELNIYLALGREDELITKLEKAIELDPYNADALTRLGTIYLKQGKYEDAVPLFEKAIELDPTRVVDRYNLSVITIEEANRKIKQANAMNYETYKTKGKALEKEANELYKDAAQKLEKVLKYEPNEMQTLQALMSVYKQLKDEEGIKKTQERLRQAASK